MYRYGYSLRIIFKQSYPNEDPNNSSLIDHFINGLQNHDLQKHVQFQHPKSLEQAIAYATEFESFTKGISSNNLLD